MTDCLDGPTGCAGEVFERLALSGSGLRYARCDRHNDEYVERTQPRIDEIRSRYPDTDTPPSWFDPMAAGERWNEDDPWP